MEGGMDYRWRDLTVLILARLTRAKLQTVHRIFRWLRIK